MVENTAVTPHLTATARLAGLLANARPVAMAVLLVAIATLGGALYIEHGMGLKPCKLCLEQRIPWYASMPLAAVLATVRLSPRRASFGLALLGLILVTSAGLAAYHAGVEWKLWSGPADCSAAITAGPTAVGDFLKQLASARVVSCTEVAIHILGLSLAAWNALISLALAGLATAAAAATYGSRTLSQ